MAGKTAFLPLSIARMIWKSPWLIAATWIAVSVAGYFAVKRMPSTYSAEAVVLVDSQKIPERFVTATVNADVQDRLATLGQEILSVGRLQKIIQEFHLYSREREKRSAEEIMAFMRRDLLVKYEKGGTAGRPPAFRISYQGPDAKVVAAVANRVAELYIEENSRDREGLAENTSNFIEGQLRDAKERLDVLEQKVSGYKVAHNGSLPQQESSLNGTLTRLQNELQGNQDALNRAHQNKIIFEGSLSVAEATESALSGKASRERGIPLAAGATAEERNLERAGRKSERLQRQMDDLLVRYSSDHPDVKRLKQEIAQARESESADALAQSQSSRPASRKVDSAVSLPTVALADPQVSGIHEKVVSLRAQVAMMEQEIKSRTVEGRRILNDIQTYQGRVEQLPIREQEMAGLTRDYEISRANYRSLLEKKLTAGMAEDMEKKQKAERFTIIDRARAPVLPIKPKRAVLMAGFSGFGLVFGLALAIVNNLRGGNILGEWELPEGVLVLGRIPLVSPILDGGFAGTPVAGLQRVEN